MRHEWDLSALYLGFDDSNLAADLQRASGIKDRYLKFCDTYLVNHDNLKLTIETFLAYTVEDITLLRKLQAYGHLSFATNSNNQEALALKNKVQVFASDMTASTVAFKTWLKGVETLDSLGKESDLIQSHLFYLKSLQDSTRYMLKPKEEVLISKLANTGSSAWETLQSKVSSQLVGEVDVEGCINTMPIMAIRNLAFHPDREMRKKGYFAELKAYEKHAEISAAALNGIKGEVLTLSELRGFESPLHETLYNSRMTKGTLDAMMSTMERFLPEFRRYLKLKSALLGNKDPMPFYDLFAPVTTVDQNYTIDEAHHFIVKYFADFSPSLSQFADRCFKAGWIDFEPAEGKVGGAFCSNIPSIGQSRVLLNFTGKLKNVLTIAHELGHAFHGDRIMSESILNTTYPMPLAETASIFCETIVRNAVLKNADDDLKLAILENSLQSATQVIVDIMSRYIFESEVFKARADYPLSTGQLNDLMIRAQKQTYGDALDPDYLHPYMWLNKTHYYYASRNFYNFPYAFGLLFATGLYAKYTLDTERFVPLYDDMLKATGKMSIIDVCALMEINPEEEAFWEASLNKIKEDIDQFEGIVTSKLTFS